MLTGTVKDRSTGETLPYANVFITGADGVYKPGAKGTITNINGVYNFDAQGTHLTASYTGMQPQTIAIGTQTTINFQLEPGANLLPEVVITATQYWPRILAGLIIAAAIGILIYKLRK